MLNKLIGDNKTMMSSLIANLPMIRFTLIPIKFIVINNLLVELPIFFFGNNYNQNRCSNNLIALNHF